MCAHHMEVPMRAYYRLLSILGDIKAARLGPGALLRRQAGKGAHGGLARVLRRILRP
jgi:hypothetical protein